MERNIFSRVLFRHFLPIVPLTVVLCISDCYAVSLPLCPTSSLSLLQCTVFTPLSRCLTGPLLQYCSVLMSQYCTVQWSHFPAGPTFPRSHWSTVLFRCMTHGLLSSWNTIVLFSWPHTPLCWLSNCPVHTAPRYCKRTLSLEKMYSIKLHV
jgi:hypothetical protein